MRIIIKSLPGNDRGPRHMEAVLRAIHAANTMRLPMTIAYQGDANSVGLYADMPAAMRLAVLELLQDAYPECLVQVADVKTAGQNSLSWSQSIRFHPDVLSLRPIDDFESHVEREPVDPAAALLAALRAPADTTCSSSVAIRFRPASRFRLLEAERILTISATAFRTNSFRRMYLHWRTDSSRLKRIVARLLGLKHRRVAGERIAQRSGNKLTAPLFECEITATVSGCTRREAQHRLRNVAGALGPFTTPETTLVVGRVRRQPSPHRRVLLSASELASIFHPTRSSVGTAKLQTGAFREMEPPAHLPSREEDADVTRLGRVRFRGQRRQFGIRKNDLRRHCFICGRTGTGKSTLIQTMALDAIEAGRNVLVVDPHGDLVEGLVDGIPRHRTNDVVYFNAADRSHPVAFNPLDCSDPCQRPLIADGLVLSFKKLYGDSWGPRLEQLLRNSVLALLETKDPTLLSIRELLTSKHYRTRIASQTSDPVVRSFWIDTFENWNERFQTEAVSPVLNKLDAFLANSIVRNITCQPRSTIHLRTIIDNPRSIFLCNLSKGLVGEQTSMLLGAFLIASLQSAALARAGMPESERNDVLVFIDEFHSFVSEGNSSFATLLSESRKYRVAFAALATQFLDQIDQATLSAVLGNCGSAVVFRSGIRDAEMLAEHLGGVTTDDIVNLPNFTAYAKLLLNGEPTRMPFSMTVSPYAAKHHNRSAVVHNVSRARFGSQSLPLPQAAKS